MSARSTNTPRRGTRRARARPSTRGAAARGSARAARPSRRLAAGRRVQVRVEALALDLVVELAAVAPRVRHVLEAPELALAQHELGEPHVRLLGVAVRAARRQVEVPGRLLRAQVLAHVAAASG